MRFNQSGRKGCTGGGKAAPGHRDGIENGREGNPVPSIVLPAGAHPPPDASRPPDRCETLETLWRDQPAEGLIPRVLAGWFFVGAILLWIWISR